MILNDEEGELLKDFLVIDEEEHKYNSFDLANKTFGFTIESMLDYVFKNYRKENIVTQYNTKYEIPEKYANIAKDYPYISKEIKYISNNKVVDYTEYSTNGWLIDMSQRVIGSDYGKSVQIINYPIFTERRK